MDLLEIQASFRFGQYEADFRSGELRKNGTRIRLQDKPLRLLAALMERQGNLVTRTELHKRLWPETTFVDFEVGLNTAVKKLRVALCDDADAPRYIETIPRRGYRFMVPVEMVADNCAHAETSLDERPASARGWSTISNVPAGQEQTSTFLRARPRIWIRAALAVVLAVLVAFGFWWVTPLPEPKIAQIYPITTTARQDFVVRPATDGARIFYVQRAGDHYDLMQVSVKGGDPQKMVVPFRNTIMWDVSPDGSTYLISGFNRRGEPSQLWSWPVTGGPPLKLDDMISGSATYSPDGKSIAFHIGKELWIGNADGSGKRKLREFEGNVDNPVWSPDGKRLRFNLELADPSIWEIGVDGEGLRPILPHWANSARMCCGSWTPDGHYFIFVELSQPSTSRLWAVREKGDWLRRSPSGPFLLASEAAGSWGPLVARDGGHVYFYSNNLQVDLEKMDLATRQFTPFLSNMRPTAPSFSRDGQWVSYARNESLWRSRLDGTDARELPALGLMPSFPRWSPDGKTLAFSAAGLGVPVNVYLVNMEGGRPQPLVPGRENLRDPDWSANGSELVVSEDIPDSAKKQAGSKLVLVSLEGRQVRELPGSEGMWMPRWSPDGSFIAALGPSQRELNLYDVASKRWSTLAQGKVLGLPVWSADGSYLYYQDSMEAGEPLRRVKLSTRGIETVADFQSVIDGGVSRCTFIAITKDGEPLITFGRESDLYGATLSAP